jgi:hypothetical protein
MPIGIIIYADRHVNKNHAVRHYFNSQLALVPIGFCEENSGEVGELQTQYKKPYKRPRGKYAKREAMGIGTAIKEAVTATK